MKVFVRTPQGQASASTHLHKNTLLDMMKLIVSSARRAHSGVRPKCWETEQVIDSANTFLEVEFEKDWTGQNFLVIQ